MSLIRVLECSWYILVYYMGWPWVFCNDETEGWFFTAYKLCLKPFTITYYGKVSIGYLILIHYIHLQTPASFSIPS
jgi:hypothetical protein